MNKSKPIHLPARLFFPAAIAHAIAFIPLSLWAMTTGTPAGLAMGVGHSGEMLASYALAVIAGKTIVPVLDNLAGACI